MNFELRQSFSHPADLVDRTYANPDLYPTLVGLPKLGDIQVLSHEEEDQSARFAIRFAFTGHLPAAVTAVVDPNRLTWVQRSIHNLETGRTKFRLLPDHYPDRLKASGTATLASTANGSERVVAGELTVSAAFVAGRVEQAIVSGLAEYLEAEAPAVDRFLAG